MGYIYKITNLINNKIYIGQTVNSINFRWRDHKNTAFNKNSPEYTWPIHAAIRKYGIENFNIEEIEFCNNKILNDREIYWINYYNSYDQGYNATLGGLGHQKYNYEEIIYFYLNNNFSLKKTCQQFNVYDQVVYTALNSYGIDYKKLGQKSGFASKNKPTRILLVEKNIIFSKITDIDKYFQKVVHPNVRRCLNGITKKAYGYHWKELADGEEIEGAIIYNGE